MTQINPLQFSMLGRLFIVCLVALAADQTVFAQGAPSGGDSRRYIKDDATEPSGGGIRVNGVDVALGGTNEPCVAVNPLNSQNVAMASLFRSRVSTNGGSTWTALRLAQLPAGYSLDGDSTMAFDSQGRLFWQYLGLTATNRGEIIISQLDPTAGTFIGGPVLITTTGAGGTGDNDKGCVAADRFVGSPFQDRLYVAWTDFGTSPRRLLVSYSIDQGANWSTALQLNTGAEGFPWPSHVAVAPNGDVYVSYHSQTGFNGIGEFGGNPDGTSGKVFVCRSTDGGVSFPQKTLAFTAGNADVTYNVQTSPGIIPGTQFWLQGAGQAWVVPDVKVPGNIYVVSNDDPDNAHGAGDDSNVYISRSTDNGMTWNAPIRVDHGPGTTFAVMPTAAMDDTTGCIVVMWYDNRLGNVNGSGHFLLDVYYSISSDRGLTWSPDVQINDVHFNPDLGAPQRLPGPPPTLRIGEYIGVTMGGGNVYGDWCGNTLTGQQTMLDSVVNACTCIAVSQQPANQVACTGGGANFSVSVSGTPSFSYQWRKGAANLTNGGSISGATSTLLTINPVAMLDAAANYNCLVSDACNSPISTNDVTLTVFAGGSGNGNGDAAADGLDVSGMVTFLVSGGSPSASYCAYDMNGDGVVDINDVGPFATFLVGL